MILMRDFTIQKQEAGQMVVCGMESRGVAAFKANFQF